MPSLLPIKARTELARSVFRDIINTNDYFYVFFGRTLPWNVGTEIPPLLTDTLQTNNIVRKNIMAIKRIQATDVVFMVPRVNWTTGTIYDRYDDVVDLSTKNFYVYNPNNSCIYKCLNRQDYIDGSTVVPSTTIPSNMTPEKFSTPDGYWWRLIYFVPASDVEKFLTSSVIPVRFFSSSTNFNCSGVIDSATVINGGSGYTSIPTIVIEGDGKGAAATATIVDGTVTAITIVDGGFGYSWATMSFDSSSGTGAIVSVQLMANDVPDDLNVLIAASAQANGGGIDFIDILNIAGGGRGVNYSPETVFTISGDGHDATVVVTFVEGGTGNIDTITIGAAGQQYTSAFITTNGPGESAQLKPILTPLYGHGGNVPAELLATQVGISVEVEDTLSEFFLNNDFRQAGIIKNINAYGVLGARYTNDAGDASYTIQVIDPSNYNDDNIITTDSGGSFTVIQVDGDFVKLLPSIDIIFESSVLINTTTSTTLASIVPDSMISPQINTKTGDVIYVQNFVPIERQTGQTETTTFYLQF